MILRIRAALVLLNLGIGAVGCHAATYTATPTTFNAVIEKSSSGDIIVLSAGIYSEIEIKDRHWSPAVIINAAAGTLRRVGLKNTSGLEWRGGTFDGADEVHSGWAASGSDHIAVDGLALHHYTRNGIILVNVSDARITNNLITDSGSDGIDIAMSRRVVIDRNECRDTLPTPGAHPDCIQLWSRPTAPPVADITITNNKASGDTQGITMFNHIREGVDDGGFDRVRIENNTIVIKEWHGVSMYSCRECVMRNNRVDTIPNGRIKAWIKSVDSDGVDACGNVATAWSKNADKRCSRLEQGAPPR